ncbi:MAG: DUF3990 domain-containing protein [Bacteroidales bacterium]|nr:DUF3990 domain-containing protein [Bacteroidales bacterium]
MILYHGTNLKIDKIDLSFGHKGKDFGQGFYLSVDKQQAMLMAERTVEREGSGKPILNAYLFDEANIASNSDLRVKLFDNYSIEWAEFIILNRNNRSATPAHNYDIVYGPIADDKVGVQINRYKLRYITIEELIRQLKFLRPTFQYYFGTEKSLTYLKPIDNE